MRHVETAHGAETARNIYVPVIDSGRFINKGYNQQNKIPVIRAVLSDKFIRQKHFVFRPKIKYNQMYIPITEGIEKQTTTKTSVSMFIQYAHLIGHMTVT